MTGALTTRDGSLRGSGGFPLGVITPVSRVPDPTGGDDTELVKAAIAAVVDGGRVEFPDTRIYRCEFPVLTTARHGLQLNVNGSTVQATTEGTRTRSHWQFNNCTDIEINDAVVIGANPAAGTGDAAYVAALEAQMAFQFMGGGGFVLNNPVASDIYGDFLYFGANPSNPSDWFDGCVVNNPQFHRNGRQGWSVVAGRNIACIGGHWSGIRRSFLDVEPNFTSGGGETISIQDCTVDQVRSNMLASRGVGGNVHDITFDNVDIIGQGVRADVVSPVGQPRRTGFTFTNCTSTLAYGTGSGLGCVSTFVHCDDITFTGNVQPMQAGRSMALVGVTDCTAYTVTGNTVLPDGIQYRVLG